MALTQVPIELSSTPGIVDNSNATAITINSSENVGIGTSSPSATLALDKNTTTQHRVLDLENNSITYSMYVDQDNSSTNSWSLFDTTNSQTALRYLPSSSGYWQFYTNNAERLRIDSSGNLLVGKTSPSFDTVGAEMRADGRVIAVRNGDPMYVTRNGSNGSLINFRKDGSAVGSIGVTSGNDLVIDGTNSSTDTGLKFVNGVLRPRQNSTDSDGDVNLGAGSFRFKDLYLSGGAYLGGTGSANKLDDYESGTLTMTGFSTVVGLTAVSHSYAHYVKVGQMITIWGRVNVTPSATGRIAWVMNTPFSVSSVSNTGQNGVLVAYPYATSNASGYVIDNSGGDATSFYCETSITNTSLAGISYCISYLTT